MSDKPTGTTSSGPLAGVKVVEIGSIGPGPHAVTLLADLGAEVIRVERISGLLTLGERDKDLLTRGRPSAAMDLKDERARDLVLRLVEQADVLVEGMRPGAMERLGLGPDECLSRNPRLVYARMTGWGQDGPLAQTAGHDITYLALTGGLHGIGRAGGPPQIPLNLVGDFGGGSMYLVTGILAGIIAARTSGQGQVVDAAIVDGAAHLQTMIVGMIGQGVWREVRGGNLLDSGAPFYDIYATSDGRHVAVGAIEPQFYAALLDGLGLDPAEVPDRNDPDQWPALRELLADTFAQRTMAQWDETFRDTDACVAPVLTIAEAAEHPHLAARATYRRDHGLLQPAPAPRFSATPADLSTPPTLPGGQTREALSRWGIDDVDALIEQGVVTQT
ncbi:MAG: CoA transferase [Micrococcales bacterium]|nr:CoA transferase [Micrococcales bacterium]